MLTCAQKSLNTFLSRVKQLAKIWFLLRRYWDGLG